MIFEVILKNRLSAPEPRYDLPHLRMPVMTLISLLCFLDINLLTRLSTEINENRQNKS